MKYLNIIWGTVLILLFSPCTKAQRYVVDNIFPDVIFD